MNSLLSDAMPCARSHHRRGAVAAWLPTLVGAVVFVLSLLLGLLALTQLVRPPEPLPVVFSSFRSLPPPSFSPPPLAVSPTRPAQTPTPDLDLPELPMPPLPDALILPRLTHEPLPIADWSPSALTLPAIEAPSAPLTLPAFDDRQAQRLFTPDLTAHYPRRAQRRGIEGRTLVRLTLSPEGRVTEAEVLDSEPAGIFEEAARRAAMLLRYEPARQAGNPIASQLEEVFQWTIR